MARNRMIKPEFWEDEDLAKLDFQTRLFYISLWNFADDEGYIKTNPEWLKAKCFPYDRANIKKLLNDLVKNGHIEISNNIAKIINFLKHQRIDRPKPSDLSTMFRRTVDEPSTTKDNINKEKTKKGNGAAKPLSFSFNTIWGKYPNRVGRKDAERHFNASVKNETDWKEISSALENYNNSDKVRAGYVQNGSTWFRNWRDWIKNPTAKPITAIPDKKVAADEPPAAKMPQEIKQMIGSIGRKI